MGYLAVVLPVAAAFVVFGYLVQIARDLHRLAATMERIETRLASGAPALPYPSDDPELPSAPDQ